MGTTRCWTRTSPRAFDEIDHTGLMDRVRARIKDKRVLALVKAFLKAGILTEPGEIQDTHTGTPQGGIFIRMLRERHHWRWKDVRRRFTTATGRWLPITGLNSMVVWK